MVPQSALLTFFFKSSYVLGLQSDSRQTFGTFTGVAVVQLARGRLPVSGRGPDQSPIETGDTGTFSVPFPQLHTPAARWAIGVSAASPDRRRRPAAGCHGKAGAG